MTTSRQYFWEVISRELLLGEGRSEDLGLRLYEDGADLPRALESALASYFSTGERRHLLKAASDAARGLFLVNENPEEHLVLIAFLLRVRTISPDTANELARLDSSNFALMSQDAVDFVGVAEMVAEEQEMGIKEIASDDFFESNLMRFSESKGFKFG